MDRFLNYTLHHTDSIPFSEENKEDISKNENAKGEEQFHDNSELPTRLEGNVWFLFWL